MKTRGEGGHSAWEPPSVRAAPPARREPVRTCVGCRGEAGKRGLIRLVRGPDGAVHRDREGRAPGRGAYLHPDPACLELARRRRALERALKGEVPDVVWEELTTPA